jgi:uncharacterized delta-60 repeat protein
MRGGGLIRILAGAVVAVALLTAPAAVDASVGNFAMAVQPDGKIVVAGGGGLAPEGGKEFGAVGRYLPNGRLDRSFGGGDGVVLLRQQRPFTAVALQKNGRIVLASPLGGRAGLTRLLPNGALDKSFGEGGYLYGGASTSWYPTNVAVAQDGGIFIGGMTGYPNDTSEHWYGWLYRVSADGRSGGYSAGMTSGAGDQPKTFIDDFVFAPGGSVIAAGTIAARRADAREHAVLTRLIPGALEPGGTPSGADPSFGGGAGLVTSNLFPASTLPEAANALSWDKGKLLIAGEASGDMLVSRYFRDGIQDNGFGRRGFWTVTLGSGSTAVANAVAVDAKGAIFAAGGSTHDCGGAECTSLVLARLGKNGHPVLSFGHSGIVRPPIGSGGVGHPAFETAYEVAARPKGKVLVGGLVGGPSGSRFFLRRYLADGTPDESFGKRGRVTTLPVAVQGAR